MPQRGHKSKQLKAAVPTKPTARLELFCRGRDDTTGAGFGGGSSSKRAELAGGNGRAQRPGSCPVWLQRGGRSQRVGPRLWVGNGKDVTKVTVFLGQELEPTGVEHSLGLDTSGDSRVSTSGSSGEESGAVVSSRVPIFQAGPLAMSQN